MPAFDFHAESNEEVGGLDRTTSTRRIVQFSSFSLAWISGRVQSMTFDEPHEDPLLGEVLLILDDFFI